MMTSSDEEPRQCKTVASRTEAAREQSDTKPRVQAPAGESLAELQRQDPDIGPILRLRLQQSNQPRPKTVISESESVKVLWGQWHSLVLKDGVLYRSLAVKHGKLDMLQLIVSTVRRIEFMRQCHQGTVDCLHGQTDRIHETVSSGYDRWTPCISFHLGTSTATWILAWMAKRCRAVL